ncbi:LLM class flavin-dependent oxidoreductase [Mycolicibacterium thermoresistibile]|jgi:FMN-dependent oxidoreductase (nitrilotriacetate monooxygenase family)|uniref:Monooxygenase n=1 Tax=Mycolicibacterium thermoresistibile TaxID=1797 RepID=A0A124E8S3_MYCTH|nr:LLM class flavin-dependent oxidoreductase [Mycolicibacterium thermoresistibile]MCV7189247.1 LLM class flavin-dependent oxidoreductase [Mycolicibacterium thermoresistibile]GAT16629.1 monooxygenase [Mycolicibacterium thermoresistibile]SNW17684.1 FMN-dependent oxidoreductase, nitrilotriacetate monooxygenase family [Mycolicibacterium thermoresistibile]
MAASTRRLHLNAFLRNVGQHEAAWRLPETRLSGITDIDHYLELARIAERGKLDAIFFADHPVLKGKTEFRPFDALDPVTLVTALSTATTHIGLVATASTTYTEPYGLARRFATLDHVSRGRAGWNIVTTANAAAAANFGRPAHPDPEHRYSRADEFLQVALRLWDSWEDDAIVGDKQAPRFVDPDKIHAIDHRGEHFSVAGPLEVPRSPQGHPVLFQAGSSEPGKQLAAKYAEAIFTAQPTVEEARQFYADVKARVRQHGRDPDRVHILPGLSAIIGGTEEEARRIQRRLEDLTVPDYGLEQLSRIVGYRVGRDDLDRRLQFGSDDPPAIHMQSRYALVRRLVSTENLTVRELLLRLSGGRGHRVFAGTPEQVADTIEEWFTTGAADGFNLIPPALPSSLTAFVDHVVPELQRRGLFRTEYTGTTLRDHLGLPRPRNRFTTGRPVAAAS